MNQRDLELLSSYLDGQLSPSDVTRLEARLKTDPQLASVLKDLRATRSLLRKLPQRRAPRNFTLTRKMVGLKPPLPRSYPFFRFASALATLMFIFSFGVNSMGRLAASQTYGYGFGGGGGGDASQEVAPFNAAESAPAAEPVATEAPAATEAPLFSSSAPVDATAQPQEDSARILETPVQKNGEDAGNAVEPEQVPAEVETLSPAPLVSPVWQIVLAAVAALSAVLMFIMQRLAMNRWK